MSEYGENIRQWMSDWADHYDQSWDDDQLASFLGKKVELKRPANDDVEREAKTFTFCVVGWSCDRLQEPDDSSMVVNKWSLLTDEGTQIAIYAGTIIEIVEEDDG